MIVRGRGDTIESVATWLAGVRQTLASTSVVLGACKPCDEPPPPPDPTTATVPVLVEGRFTGAAVVELVFSVPLAPTDGVDPAKFRLSVARGDTDDDRTACFARTDYCDLSVGLSEYGCGTCGGYGAYDYGHDECPPRIAVESIALHDEDPTRLVLSLGAPIRPLLCLQVDYAGDDAGIMLHYSARDIPTITSATGTKLADIAPAWVLEDRIDAYEDAMFPSRDAFVAIRCPEDFD